MRSYNAVWFTAVLAGYLLSVDSAAAQSHERVQPIILTVSPVCCQSPADTASQPVCLPAGDGTYLPVADRDPLAAIGAASRLMPLPTPQQWRGYDSDMDTVVAYPTSVTSFSGAEPVHVLRPLAIAPPAPSVPDGYVVGRGLIGQPKLYKPGQPLRNFLRYISL